MCLSSFPVRRNKETTFFYFLRVKGILLYVGVSDLQSPSVHPAKDPKPFRLPFPSRYHRKPRPPTAEGRADTDFSKDRDKDGYSEWYRRGTSVPETCVPSGTRRGWDETHPDALRELVLGYCTGRES